MKFSKEFSIAKLEDVVMHLEHAHREVEEVFATTKGENWSLPIAKIADTKAKIERALDEAEFAVYLLKKETV